MDAIERFDVNEDFAHRGGPEALQFQVDAAAYCGKSSGSAILSRERGQTG